MAAHIPKPGPENERRAKTATAPDVAREDTLPTNHPATPDCASELHQQELDSTNEDEQQADRTARYLKGPTAFSA